MPNVSSFGAQTDNSVVQGTVTDRAMVIPDIPPQGLMSVGPRVTPHFVKPSLWSALTTYHFFDAVHDAAGASYVAIKPEVPAGTDLNDEEFWFLWADPNSQFADLSELVKTYNGRITKNTSDIAALNGKVDEGVTALTGKIETAQKAADDADAKAQSSIDKQKKYMLLFGDSWTDDINGTWGSGTKWYRHVCKALQLTPLNYAHGGYSFGPQFDSELDKAKAEITDDVKSNITEVVIYGGLNNLNVSDYSGLEFVNQVNDFVQSVYNWISTAKITVVLANSAKVTSDRISMRYVHYTYDMRQLMYLNITQPGINLVFGQYWTLGYDCYSEDNYHLNDLGNRIVASRMIQAITGGNAEEIWGASNYDFINGTWTPSPYSKNYPGFPIKVEGCSTNSGGKFKFGTYVYNDGFVGFTNIQEEKATIKINLGKIEPKREFINFPGFKSKYSITNKSTDDDVIYTIEITNPNGNFVNGYVPCELKFEF